MRISIFILLFLFSIKTPASGFEIAKKRVNQLVSEPDAYPSVAVVVIKENRTFFYSAGNENITERSIIEIGSNTKVFTGILFAKSIVEGKLNLDSKVNEIFDKQVLPQDIDRQLTLEHLSTQSSGLPKMPSNFPSSDLKNPYQNYSQDNLFTYLKSLSFRNPMPKSCEKDNLDEVSNKVRKANSCYHYSNTGVTLLGAAIAAKHKTPFPDLLKSHISKQLGLNDTDTKVHPNNLSRMVQGYNWEKHPTPFWDFDVMAPTGALKSSFSDIAQFLAFQLEPDDSNLGKASRLSQKERSEIGGQKMGLGWHINQVGQRTFHWHNGKTYGFTSFMGIDTKNRVAVFIVGNQMKIINGNFDHRIDDAGFEILKDL